jgi:cytochrome P450 family 135
MATTGATTTFQPAEAAPQTRMPPGPPLPRLIQTALLTVVGLPYLKWLYRRYGNAVTIRTLFQPEPGVAVFDPALTKQVFQGPHEQLRAGEANSLLAPLLGQRSVIVLDGAEHMRHRRLVLPPFHGKALQRYEQAIVEAADAEIDAWPLGVPFAVTPSMQNLTLRVISSLVFGFAPDEAGELIAALRAYIDPIGQPRSMRAIIGAALQRAGVGGNKRTQAFVARRQAVDDLVYAEIARRRALPEEQLAIKDDVFSTLLLAQDEEGERLSDVEVRDELLTLLVAGHETTATGLAWTLDLLLHSPAALERAKQGDDAYLDAVFKEALRIRPVLGLVGRVVRGAPFQLGEWMLPDGTEINPWIRVIHTRPDLYPEPDSFLPERYLSEDGPDTYTWIPFGGGTRRCIGAAFAATEARLVLRQILKRTEIRAASPKLEEVQMRIITMTPRNGTRIVLEHRP